MATCSLHSACAEGNLVAAAKAIEAGAKINAFNGDGLSAVHLAASAGSAALVQQLAAAPGFQVGRGREADGSTALHCVCDDGTGLEVATALLECGADPNAENLDGCTPLHCAAHMGGLEHVKLLLTRGAQVDRVNYAGQTPLLMAAEASGTCWVDRECNYAGVMQALLEAGADPNLPDSCGDTALHLALRARAAAAVAALCHGGADVTSLSGRLSGRVSPLHICAATGDVESMQHVLTAGADTSAAEAEGGLTPLHVAAQAGHVQAVNALLKAGASLAVRCSSGLTALHLAAQEGHAEVLAALLPADTAASNSAPSESKTENSDSPPASAPPPLHMACHGGHLQAAQVLVQHGHSVCAVDRQLNTALHIASQKGHTAVVQWLLSCREGPTAADMRNAQGKLPAELCG